MNYRRDAIYRVSQLTLQAQQSTIHAPRITINSPQSPTTPHNQIQRLNKKPSPQTIKI